MAFSGTAVVKLVAEDLVRITGLSLGEEASGTISLFEGTGQVKCPDKFDPDPYDDVTLQDAISVRCLPAREALDIVKTGTTKQNFLITFTNPAEGETIGPFEFYIRFH